MNYVIEGYEPQQVFRYFEEISAVPRGSGQEKGISEYLCRFAKEHGLEYHTDALYNVIIKKAGSAGCENAPAVMLQGHQDMVCEKNAGVEHDFETDGIEIVVDREKGLIHANGTTLGADNGIAMAYMLAILSDETLKHPPLECVFTVQEETGLYGAAGIDGNLLKARTMINLDSEEEGIATVSCAGGLLAYLEKQAEWESVADGQALSVSIRGLLGGHSGIDIVLERGNSNKIMARLLYRLMSEIPMNLVSVAGGNKTNAIPREADAVVVVKTEDAQKAKEILKTAAAEILDELASVEKALTIAVEETNLPEKMLSKGITADYVKLAYLCPDGVISRNVQNGGFVISSLNVGLVTTSENSVCLGIAPRSSVASQQEETKRRLSLLADTFGFTAEYSGDYPGWSYAEVSPIRDVFAKCYRELFDAELKVEAIHAGLECGLFADKLPGLDAIAVGPTMHGVHTPDEALEIDACEKVWKLLIKVLENLAK